VSCSAGSGFEFGVRFIICSLVRSQQTPLTEWDETYWAGLKGDCHTLDSSYLFF